LPQKLESPPPAELSQKAESPLQVSRLSAGLVIAPIPGVVKSILVKEGDAVKEGDVVLVLEAMKMDNEISSRSSGKVKTIHIAIGDSVQEDQVLIDIEAK
jgi:biotin carboxyl carrier protein